MRARGGHGEWTQEDAKEGMDECLEEGKEEGIGVE